jgi:two-component system, NarL family, sensor kinase
MRKFVFVILIFVSNIAFGGRPIIDSLAKEVATITAKPVSIGRDTLLITALWNLTYYSTYFREKNTKFLLDSLERLSNRTKWIAGKGMFLNAKSFYTSNFLSDYSKALVYALDAKEILKKTNQYKAIAYTDLRICSNLLWNLNNGKNVKFSTEGIQIAKEMIALGEKKHDIDIKCQGLIYAANHYNFIGDSTNAKSCLRQSGEIIKNNRVSYLAENVHYGTYGVLLSYTNQIQKAIEYWDKCLEIAKPQNDYYTLTSMYRLKADYYFQYAPERNLKLAKSLAEESYKYAQKLGILLFISLSEKNLYLINRMQGNNTEALKYFEYYWVHEDSLSRERIQKTYADYELLQKETQIKTLENDKLQTEANRQKMIRNLLIISLLMGCGLVFYFFKNNQQLKTKNREIEEALQKGQTLERKRVAQELHDNLSAKISGIRWRLEAIEPDFKKEKHKQIYESSVNALAEVYTDVRLIAHNLLPAELETKGLSVALHSLVKELNGLNKTEFSLNINENIGRFHNKIEYEIFSIILELSNNILKHSQAKNALISLEIEKNVLKLLVSDNGIGIEEDSIKKGMGMSNLKSRVASLNGKMTIESKEGVWVGVDVPIY